MALLFCVIHISIKLLFLNLYKVNAYNTTLQHKLKYNMPLGAHTLFNS